MPASADGNEAEGIRSRRRPGGGRRKTSANPAAHTGEELEKAPQALHANCVTDRMLSESRPMGKQMTPTRERPMDAAFWDGWLGQSAAMPQQSSPRGIHHQRVRGNRVQTDWAIHAQPKASRLDRTAGASLRFAPATRRCALTQPHVGSIEASLKAADTEHCHSVGRNTSICGNRLHSSPR